MLFLKFAAIGLACVGNLPTPAWAGDTKVLNETREAIARVVEQNTRAVVHLKVTEHQGGEYAFPSFAADHAREFLDNVGSARARVRPSLKRVGTGTVIDSKGHIITSSHLAAGATEFQVSFIGGNKYPAKLIGIDLKTTLAVVRISTDQPFPHVTFGDSDNVTEGEWVVAIDRPRDLDQIVTHGLISSTPRSGTTDIHGYRDLLWSDTKTSPTNAGGPLFNLRGEVVGINTALVPEAWAGNGLSFAIPSDTARCIAKKLISDGCVKRGWLGISVEDITPVTATTLHLDRVIGALILNVVTGGPADKAGISERDVVIRYREREITEASNFLNEIASTPIGKEVNILVLRNGRRHTFCSKVGNLQQMMKEGPFLLQTRLGIDVRPASRESGQHGFHSQGGVIVTWVHPDSPLADVGVEVNDMMLEINGKAIHSLESLVDLVSALTPGQRITLYAVDHRSGRTGYVHVVIP